MSDHWFAVEDVPSVAYEDILRTGGQVMQVSSSPSLWLVCLHHPSFEVQEWMVCADKNALIWRGNHPGPTRQRQRYEQSMANLPRNAVIACSMITMWASLIIISFERNSHLSLSLRLCVLKLKLDAVCVEVHHGESPHSEYCGKLLAVVSHEDLPVEQWSV